MTNCSPTRRSADLRGPQHGGADGGGLTQGRVTVTAKICGINDARAMQAAAAGGASHVGMVFYPPSPRAVTPAIAGDLAVHAGNARKVGLFVDPEDALIDAVLARVALDLLRSGDGRGGKGGGRTGRTRWA